MVIIKMKRKYSNFRKERTYLLHMALKNSSGSRIILRHQQFSRKSGERRGRRRRRRGERRRERELSGVEKSCFVIDGDAFNLCFCVKQRRRGEGGGGGKI